MLNSIKTTLNVTLGFMPLMLLWSISSKWALILGLLSVFILLVKSIVEKSIGIMNIVMFIYFSFSNILYFFFKINAVIQYRYLTSYAILALMGFISVWLRKPYTMYDARSGYRKEFWNSPLFIEVNILITKIWAAIYSIGLLIECIAHNGFTVVLINTFVVLGMAASIIIPSLLPEA